MAMIVLFRILLTTRMIYHLSIKDATVSSSELNDEAKAREVALKRWSRPLG